MKFRYITFVLFICSISTFAQNPLDPGWQWAERGGSNAPLISGSFDDAHERIIDVKVDAANNYYYLAEIAGYSITLEDMEFDTYNDEAGRRDIFIFSTDDEGNYRWSKVIGGGFEDNASSLDVDADGSVYLSGTVVNVPLGGAYNTPVHFDTDSIMPVATLTPDSTHKKIFIINYDSEGNFQWLRQPESDETPLGKSGRMLKMIVEPDGTTHSLIALIAGTYFDGQLTIPPMDTIGNITPMQSMIIKYDSAGGFEGYTLIDMKPIDGLYNFQLAYDPNLDRYYIGDTNRGNGVTNPLSINGYGAETIDKAFYLSAVNSEGEVIWYHENELLGGNAVGNVAVDNNGNIYCTGMAEAPDNFAGYLFDPEISSIGDKNPFLIKLNSNGYLIWGTNAKLESPFVGQSIVIKGNNVYLGLGMVDNIWDGVEISGPEMQGFVPDIQIVRFDAETGVAQEVIQNNAITPTRDAIMAMALDNNGDLVVGGYFGSDLFAGSDFHLHNNAQDSDFFIAKYHLSDTTSGVAENSALKNIRAYPNPISGLLNLQSDIVLNRYTISDLQGREVARGRVANNQIDLSGLESGVYVLRVRSIDGGVWNMRVVKE